MRKLACTLVAASFVLAPLSGLSADPETQVPAEIVSPSSVGEVVFPHRKHVEELNFGCSDCHHETRAAVLEMPHPQYFEDFWIDCKICHRAGSAPLEPLACSTCHHSAPSSVADQTLSAKVVIHRSCWGCHDPGSGEKATETCSFCHNRQRIADGSAANAARK